MWLTTECQFLFRKRGYFYFSRRVPSDLQGHYKSPRIVLSLKTKSARIAASQSASIAAKLDRDWMSLRWRSSDDSLSRFFATPTKSLQSTSGPSLSQATARYIEAKRSNRSEIFVRSTERATRYFIEASGDKPIDAYERTEVNAARDHMFARGLSQVSVRRLFSAIQAIVNFVAREDGVDNVKAFSSVYFGEVEADAAEKRSKRPARVLLFDGA